MKKKKILVFPCGSEVGLEIHRSLRHSRHIELWGGSSVDDHGKFVFKNYIANFPFINDNEFIPYLKKIINKYKLEAIFPAMDEVICVLAKNEKAISCKIISAPLETVEVCLSKQKTYKKLHGVVNIPKIYSEKGEIENFPVFMKPDVGYGSRGAKKIRNERECCEQLKQYPNSIILEYLPGEEYTVDCFTDRKGKLLFAGARQRRRIRMGISVNTISMDDSEREFYEIARKINDTLIMRGGWFFQVKRNEKDELVLLEVASRIGGSSSLFRGKGVNLPLLSVFDVFDLDVNVIENEYIIEMDRALDTVYKTDLKIDKVYIDLDDCLIINGKVNISLIALVFKMHNNGKEVILLTKNDEGNLNNTLKSHGIDGIFSEIIHIDKNDEKYKYITSDKSIFIDDSFSERKKIKEVLNIPVFSPDMCEVLFTI